MLVREVMTSPPITIEADGTISSALKLLDEAKITALPVLDRAGSIVGIVSEADLVQDSALLEDRVPLTAVRTTTESPPRRVTDVMTHLVVTVRPNDELTVAVELMWSSLMKSLPVVDRGEVVGVISRSDVIHLLAARDDRIRAEVRELLVVECADWEVSVQDGVVTVTGPADEHERRIAAVLAGTVRGTLAVRLR
ncbi:BON domain-containing protein [Kribbella amoyensis]|uniref:BON domain-containing protein n=2 Tax=Kribbella amoyensis TaxID=996641 RepID=A0A561C159_9ACTN|nr:BON domain-containing protein [Kribbella amoyensis]